MRRLRSDSLWLAVAIVSLWTFSGCGGHPPKGVSQFPARINLSPAANTSLQIGSDLVFTATAQNSSGSSVSAIFTYTSSDTSVLNVAPNGVACAGVWDPAFTICTPAGIGVVQVTATTQGVTSAPTWVFVHPPIDSVTVTGILLNGLPIQEPCLSQGQSMTLEAHAFSQGTEITASVGPFTWTANNVNVATITPLVNNDYNFPTNQATAKANLPGMTQIYATAGGVTSTSFQQPSLVPNPPVVFSFFETCPIQNIVLEVGHAGSEQNSFVATRGATETVVATITDVMGNSSLPNSVNNLVLSKVPLTWTATQPASIGLGSSCQQSCPVTTPSIGAGTVTASCSPPTCNIGFPYVPPELAPASLAACAQYVHSQIPQVTSCAQFVPQPVYASPLPLVPPPTNAAIAGLVEGTSSNSTSPVSAVATSLGCIDESPVTCTTGIYDFTTAKAITGSATPLPTSPNSFLFDLAGDKLYMGSTFGALIIAPGDFGTSTNPFTSLGTVTGRVLAISANGTVAVFSDTIHPLNQVYIVNVANSSAPTSTALNINGASVAAFSPDGLKTFIFGYDSNGNPNLYIYSTLQALDIIPLPPQTTINSIVFSANGAFAYVVEPSLGGAGPAVSVYNTCDNQLFTDSLTGLHDIPLAASPIAFRALPDGIHFLALESNGTLQSITADIAGIPVATLSQPATSLCPMTVGHEPLQTIDLGQGTIQPMDFFVSPDASLIYILASNRSSVLVYSSATGGVTGIPLVGSSNPTPITADMSIDGTTIVVAATDGLLHQISTAFGGSDAIQLTFPNLANYTNPFCTITPAAGPCTLSAVAVKP